MDGSLGRLVVLLAAGLPMACGGSTGTGDPCAGVDCSGHGVCFAVADSHYCWCAADWFPVGDACVQPDGGDPCDYVDCEGHGTCWMNGGETRCRCETGWEELVPGHCIRPVPDGGPPEDAASDGEPPDDADPDGDEPDGVADVPTGCETTADCAPFEDGDACNGTLVCRGGACEVDPATVVACPTGGDTDCRANTCDAATGACSLLPIRESLACDDGLFCTLSDGCAAGECRGSGSPCAGGACSSGCDDSSDECAVASAGTTCRGAAGPCDTAEACDGSAAECPADVFVSGSTQCRPAAGPCDEAESCTGWSAACPSDVFVSGSIVCRPSTGGGDPAEYCTGTSADCPPDVAAECTPGTSQPCGSCGTQFCDDYFHWGPCLGDAGSPCDAYCGGYCCDCSHDCPGVGGDWCVDDDHGTCHGGCGSHICP